MFNMSDSSKAKKGKSNETKSICAEDNNLFKKPRKRKKKAPSRYCTICCKLFATPSSFYQHKRKYHFQESKFENDQLQKTNHEKQKYFKLESSSKRSKKKDFYIELQKAFESVISSVELPPYEVDQNIYEPVNTINEDSTSPQELHNHKSETYTSTQQIECEKCHFMFNTESNYNEHKIIGCSVQQKDTNENDVEQNICYEPVSHTINEDGSTSPQELHNQASETYNSTQQIEYEKCHFMFNTESNYNEHKIIGCSVQRKDMNQNQNRTDENHINIVKQFCSIPDEFECKICNKLCNNPNHFEIHEWWP